MPHIVLRLKQVNFKARLHDLKDRLVSKKVIFCFFQIDLIAIFHLKKSCVKKKILSKVINEKRFFPLIISN